MFKNPHQGGYSEIWLWPCYSVYSALSLVLMAKFGVLAAVLPIIAATSFVFYRIVKTPEQEVVPYNLKPFAEKVLSKRRTFEKLDGRPVLKAGEFAELGS